MKFLFAITVAVLSSATLSHASKLTDSQIRKKIIEDSISSYDGSCPCPYNADRAGSRCSGRSAYSRPGGAEPYCYPKDVSDSMVKEYRNQLTKAAEPTKVEEVVTDTPVLSEPSPESITSETTETNESVDASSETPAPISEKSSTSSDRDSFELAGWSKDSDVFYVRVSSGKQLKCSSKCDMKNVGSNPKLTFVGGFKTVQFTEFGSPRYCPVTSCSEVSEDLKWQPKSEKKKSVQKVAGNQN